MSSADAIPDAPVYAATMAEMENLEELLAKANLLAMQYGAVRIDPPAAWAQPPLRMNPKSRFFVRMQTLPASPFADPEFIKHTVPSKHHPRKRVRRKPPTVSDEDSDEPVVVPKDPKNASRDRAARAASRSHRNHQYSSAPDHQTLADHIAKVDFHAARTAPNQSLELPPNPTCTPAMSPPPESYVPGSLTSVGREFRQSLPCPIGQTPARPILPRPPASQIQPTMYSTGQTAAVQEAAMRLAEVFTGFPKAGPASSAPAIPPCPFSQRTAQEHMAKRTADDQPRLSRVPSLPVPQSLSEAPPSSTLQTNRTEANASCQRENVERTMRYGEANLNRNDTSFHRNDEGREGLNPRFHDVQKVTMSVCPPEKHAENQEYPSTCVRTSTEAMKYSTYNTGAKNIEANDRANLKNTLSSQILPTLSPANHGVQLNTFPMVSSGIKRADYSSADATMPASVKPCEAPCHKDTADQNLQDAVWTAPFLSCPTTSSAPSAVVPLGNNNNNVAKMNNEGRYRPSTMVPVPIQVFQSRSAASDQPSTGFHTHVGGLSPSVHSITKSQTNTPQIANIIHPPPIPLTSNTAGIQEGHLQKQHVVSLTSAKPDHSSCPSALHKQNDFNFAHSVPIKMDFEMVPHSNTGLIKTPPAQARNMDVGRQTTCIAEMESVLSVPSKLNNERKSTLVEKQSTGPKLLVNEDSYGKASHDPGWRFGESHHQSVPILALGAASHVDQSKQASSNAQSAASLQRTSNKEYVPQSSFPCLLDGNRVSNGGQECSTSYFPCKREPSLAEPSQILSLGPMLKSSCGTTTWNPGYRVPAGLSGAKPVVPTIVAKELVENILAAATRGADITAIKTRPAKILQEQTTNYGVLAGHSRHTGTLNIEAPCSATILDASQKERLTSHRRKIEGSSGKRLICNQDKDTSLTPRPGQPDSLRQQQTCQPCKQKKDISLVPGPERSAPLYQKQPAHSLQLKERAVKAEEVVVVAERRVAKGRQRETMKRSKLAPIINVDGDTPAAKTKYSSASKPPAKRPAKRKMENRHLHFDQDDAGRLTKAIMFPDSGTPISLAAYEKKAREHYEKTKMTLSHLEDEGTDIAKAKHSISKTDTHNVDSLEEEFWKAMGMGIRGKPITVAYGVDVEAEGAFNSSEMSYVEWHEVDPRELKPNKRKRGRSRRPKEPRSERKPLQSSENASDKPTSQGPGSCSHDLHHDADDEMERNDKTPSRDTVRERISHLMKGKSNPSESIYQRSKSTGPRKHVGTLNRDGILRHLPRMPGINHSMYYVGQLFTRFCWHTEDAFLNSVSYLHPGSAEKVWYAVPPRYASAFEEYAASNVFSPNLLEDESTGQLLLMNKTTMFDPRGVRRKGVLVYRVVHKPGSFVLTAARAYHAGFNCGFNIAEAVNFANPTWFPVGREASAFARRALKPLCVPWEYLLFHEAKSMRDIGVRAIKGVVSTERLADNAGVVAKELKAIIMDGERKIRIYAESRNCRVSMLHDIDGLAKHNQVGPEFGNGAGMVCSLCAHTCHFYAEMCGSCDDSFEARCVDHFGEGHKLCLEDDHKTVIVRRHDPVLLLDILGSLERMAGIDVGSSELARRYLGYLRSWQTPLRSSGLRMRLNLNAASSRLPPKVSKEKGNRENGIQDKGNRDRNNRERRRKISKSREMFSKAELRGKRGMFPQIGTLADGEFVASKDMQQHDNRIEEGKCKGVEVSNRIPLL